MEETDVVITGGGPSGLALSVALSHQHIKNIVLELNDEICEDPRAIAITGDTSRILRVLGVTDDDLSKIGQGSSLRLSDVANEVNVKLTIRQQGLSHLEFHHGAITDPPFLTMDNARDWLGQAMPLGVMIFQPKLEQILRQQIASSSFSQLRTKCRVVARKETEDAVEVSYEGPDQKIRLLRCRFLVGADGKKGVVRKHFLESRGIKQETGVNEYSGTWIAANLKISIPTPKSHPEFPLWECGYTEEEIFDLFWPPGFHFCNDPVSPVAAGRFGPMDQKYWSWFEYELPTNERPKDSIDDLKGQMERHLTLPANKIRNGNRLGNTRVQFPWECVEIIRCGPAFFTHRVVNRWFDQRTILIGDAAHVFPPFGAQGIANGVRDALSLSWRISLLLKQGGNYAPQASINRRLNEWSRERREGVDKASKLTMDNGNLLNNKSWLVAQLYYWGSTMLDYIPGLKEYLQGAMMSDAEGYTKVKDGFFLPSHGGGGKMAQIWLRAQDGALIPSDKLFWHADAFVTLLIIGDALTASEHDSLKQMIAHSELPQHVLTSEIACIDFAKPAQGTATNDRIPGLSNFTPCGNADVKAAGIAVPSGYDGTAMQTRFISTTRFVLVRPDFIIFSQASSLKALMTQLAELKRLLAE